MQRALQAAGYPIAVIDGIWGAEARAYALDWQQRYRQAMTGRLTEQQVAMLGQRPPGVTAPPVASASPGPSPAPVFPPAGSSVGCGDANSPALLATPSPQARGAQPPLTAAAPAVPASRANQRQPVSFPPESVTIDGRRFTFRLNNPRRCGGEYTIAVHAPSVLSLTDRSGAMAELAPQLLQHITSRCGEPRLIRLDGHVHSQLRYRGTMSNALGWKSVPLIEPFEVILKEFQSAPLTFDLPRSLQNNLSRLLNGLGGPQTEDGEHLLELASPVRGRMHEEHIGRLPSLLGKIPDTADNLDLVLMYQRAGAGDIAAHTPQLSERYEAVFLARAAAMRTALLAKANEEIGPPPTDWRQAVSAMEKSIGTATVCGRASPSSRRWLKR